MFIGQTTYSDVVIPPFRFGSVEINVFRGAYPTLRNYRYLSRLKLQTVISLVPEEPLADLKYFCHCEKIELVHINAEKPSPETLSLGVGEVSRVLSILCESERLPAFVHCLDGGAVTGLLIFCLRKLQHWSLAAAKEEYQRYCFLEDIPRLDEVTKFVHQFADEVEIRGTIPSWLWGGDITFIHPTIKVKMAFLDENPCNTEEGQLDSSKGKDLSKQPSQKPPRPPAGPRNTESESDQSQQASHSNLEDLFKNAPNSNGLSRSVQALNIMGLSEDLSEERLAKLEMNSRTLAPSPGAGASESNMHGSSR